MRRWDPDPPRGGAPCTGLACLSKIDDPLNPGTQVCVDSKGGVSQLCCNGNTTKPCFTLANNGVVNRSGHQGVPQPALPDTTYPKQADTGVLASTFCIPSTGKSAIDQVTGLPDRAPSSSPGRPCGPSSDTPTASPEPNDGPRPGPHSRCRVRRPARFLSRDSTLRELQTRSLLR